MGEEESENTQTEQTLISRIDPPRNCSVRSRLYGSEMTLVSSRGIRSQVHHPTVLWRPFQIDWHLCQRRFGKELGEASRLLGTSRKALELLRGQHYNSFSVLAR